MNIFVTDECPKKSALALDDSRCIKMILESAQLMSNAIGKPYKQTHYNHPCSVWTMESRENYFWLLEHFKALCEEYTKRFGKVHKCFQYYQLFKGEANKIPINGLKEFKNCTPEKNNVNTFLAYKTTLINKWINDKRKPKWTNSCPPNWYKI